MLDRPARQPFSPIHSPLPTRRFLSLLSLTAPVSHSSPICLVPRQPQIKAAAASTPSYCRSNIYRLALTSQRKAAKSQRRKNVSNRGNAVNNRNILPIEPKPSSFASPPRSFRKNQRQIAESLNNSSNSPSIVVAAESADRLEQVDKLLFRDACFPDQRPQSSFGQFPMIGHRESAHLRDGAE